MIYYALLRLCDLDAKLIFTQKPSVIISETRAVGGYHYLMIALLVELITDNVNQAELRSC